MAHTIIVIIQKMRLKINKTNRGQIDLGNDEIQDGPGPVLHQPLSLAFFRKNSQNGQNMNGIPVSRSRKTENAPTWRSPSPLFGGCFRALFWPILYVSILPYTIILFIYSHLKLTTRYGTTTLSLLLTSQFNTTINQGVKIII